MKSTALAPSNLAFVKYWGRKDETLRLPTNGSISMNLSNCTTTTTVEFVESLTVDEIMINNERREKEVERVVKHLDRVRSLAGIKIFARVVSETNFPVGTGLSSSSSAFAALSVAAAAAAGVSLSEKELSILARQGSGSACRSIPSGFTQWLDADASEESYAVSIFPASHWNIVDVIAVVSSERKLVSTSIGQQTAHTSPFFKTRLQQMNEKLEQCKALLSERNFTAFGAFIEAEALELHTIMLTQTPPLLYWNSASLALMKQVQEWRRNGELEAYFTVNTGQDVHIICQEKDSKKLQSKLKEVDTVKNIIVNQTAEGTRLIDKHLF